MSNQMEKEMEEICRLIFTAVAVINDQPTKAVES